MLNKYSSLQILFGVLMLPALISLFVADRIICVPLVWIKTPGFKEFMTDWKQFVMSLYRVLTVFVLFLAVKLIMWVL
jgi:hypothetical protein